MSGITLQFCAFDSLAGRLVTFGTQGNVGHTSIVLPSGDLLDAQNEDGLGGKPPGVQIRPASYIKETGGYNVVRITISASKEVANAAYSWALMQVGAEYDLRADEGIALNQDWSTPGKFICSGLAAGTLTQPKPAVISYPLAKPWRIVSPEQLLLICSAFSYVVPVP